MAASEAAHSRREAAAQRPARLGEKAVYLLFPRLALSRDEPGEAAAERSREDRAEHEGHYKRGHRPHHRCPCNDRWRTVAELPFTT